MMKLQNSVDIGDFLNTVATQCGDVYYLSAEGDTLNLKSELCKYLFAVAVAKPDIFSQGKILCRDPGDYEYLSSYLQEV